MITGNERFIELQSILALSDIHPADCIKINDLIIELSKENQQLKDRIDKAIELIEKNMYFYSGLQNEDLEIGLFEDEINVLLEILKGVI